MAKSHPFTVDRADKNEVEFVKEYLEQNKDTFSTATDPGIFYITSDDRFTLYVPDGFKLLDAHLFLLYMPSEFKEGYKQIDITLYPQAIADERLKDAT